MHHTRYRLVPLKHGNLLLLLLLPGGNDVVDEVAAGAVASVQHMLSSVVRLLEEDGQTSWHHKGFRCAACCTSTTAPPALQPALSACCVPPSSWFVLSTSMCVPCQARRQSLPVCVPPCCIRYVYCDEALNAVKGTPAGTKGLSKDTQQLSCSVAQDAEHAAAEWPLGEGAEMVRRGTTVQQLHDNDVWTTGGLLAGGK